MKKTIMAFLLIAAMVFTNTVVFADKTEVCKAADTKFNDISGHWAEEAINKIIDKDIFTEKAGKFQPNKPITRSEFALMLHKAMGIQIAYFKATDIKEYFDDVKNEDIYAGALYDLVTTNIIDSKGHFNPNAKLTREDMIHYIMNAYRYKMGDNYKMTKIAYIPFADDKNLNPSYLGDIARAVNMGLIKRPANNKFYPKNDSTRGQAAVITYRLVNMLEQENSQVTVVPTIEVKDGTLKMKLTVTNNSKKPVVIEQGGQKLDFSLLDKEKTILYTWSANKMFTMELAQTVIEPGKSVEFSGEVEKDVWESIKGKVVYLKAYLVGASRDFSINTAGYEIEVK